MWPKSQPAAQIFCSQTSTHQTHCCLTLLLLSRPTESCGVFSPAAGAQGLFRGGVTKVGLSTRLDLLFYLQTINIYYLNNHFCNEQLT